MPLKALRNRFRGPEYDCNAKTLGYAWSISTYRRTVPQNRRARRAGDSTMPNSAATLHANASRPGLPAPNWAAEDALLISGFRDVRRHLDYCAGLTGSGAAFGCFSLTRATVRMTPEVC